MAMMGAMSSRTDMIPIICHSGSANPLIRGEVGVLTAGFVANGVDVGSVS